MVLTHCNHNLSCYGHCRITMGVASNEAREAVASSLFWIMTRVSGVSHTPRTCAFDLMTKTGARLTMSGRILLTLIVLQVRDSQGTGILL